jgi:hypothetical protein
MALKNNSNRLNRRKERVRGYQTTLKVKKSKLLSANKHHLARMKIKCLYVRIAKHFSV